MIALSIDDQRRPWSLHPCLPSNEILAIILEQKHLSYGIGSQLPSRSLMCLDFQTKFVFHIISWLRIYSFRRYAHNIAHDDVTLVAHRPGLAVTRNSIILLRLVNSRLAIGLSQPIA